MICRMFSAANEREPDPLIPFPTRMARENERQAFSDVGDCVQKMSGGGRQGGGDGESR